VEFTGMSRICDFETQVVLPDGSRPDMVIKLTGNRCIVVDSKAPLTSYQQAVACSDSTLADELYKKHADTVRNHIANLSKKQYPSKMNGMSPDFVVLFLPSESLYSAALIHKPELLEYAAASKVLITSPSTLMGKNEDEVLINVILTNIFNILIFV
jgi:DNA recombination protein RmuC